MIKGFGSAALNGSGDGILIGPTSGNVNFRISDTILSGNYSNGIHVAPSIFGGAQGTGSAVGIITRVQVTGSHLNGVAVVGDYTTGKVAANLSQTDSSNNIGLGPNGTGSTGFFVSNGSLYLTRSMATNNGVGLAVVSNAKAYTYGDNAINGNFGGPGSDVLGTLTPSSPK